MKRRARKTGGKEGLEKGRGRTRLRKGRSVEGRKGGRGGSHPCLASSS